MQFSIIYVHYKKYTKNIKKKPTTLIRDIYIRQPGPLCSRFCSMLSVSSCYIKNKKNGQNYL